MPSGQKSLTRHSSQVRDLFHDIRAGLADVVFGYAAQGGLSANDVLRLLDYLAKVTQRVLKYIEELSRLVHVEIGGCTISLKKLSQSLCFLLSG